MMLTHKQARPRTRSLLAPWRAWVAAVCLAAIMPAVLSAGELVDRVLAVVSGSIITLSDARAAIELGFVDTRGGRDPVAVALQWLIERRLVLDEALRYEAIDSDMVSVEAMLWASRRRFPTEAAWESAKRRLGLTDEAIRDEIADTLSAEQFVDRRFDVQSAPSDPELLAYIDRHRGDFVRDGRALTFEEARATADARVRRERRAQAVSEWVARLRRRADVSELYTPTR